MTFNSKLFVQAESSFYFYLRQKSRETINQPKHWKFSQETLYFFCKKSHQHFDQNSLLAVLIPRFISDNGFSKAFKLIEAMADISCK